MPIRIRTVCGAEKPGLEHSEEEPKRYLVIRELILVPAEVANEEAQAR